MQSQLKASPLTIELHEFRSIRVEASVQPTPKGSLSIRTVRHVEQHIEEPRRWMVDLTVDFHSSSEEDPAPYSGSINACGWFTVVDGYPNEKQPLLIEVTAVSILYGACREMIASFTARSSHGILSLPSVSFAPMSELQSKSAPAPKKAARKSPKAAGKAPKK
jgi:preprotein translocase subunit SecB